MKPLAREDRVTLATTRYGLYIIGMAFSPGEIIDENCAMDNIGVPFYEEMLSAEDKKALEESYFWRDFVGPHLPIEVTFTVTDLSSILHLPTTSVE